MSLIEQLDSAILAAIGDIADSDLDHVLGSDGLVQLVRQQRRAIAALEADSATEARAGIAWEAAQ